MHLLVRVDPRRFEGADVVLAFPGAGLVGGIAVEELVETLGLRPVGSLGGTLLPAQLVVEGGRPYWPAVAFARPGLVAIHVQSELDDAGAHRFGRAFARAIAEAGARSLFVVDGIPGAPIEMGDLLDGGLHEGPASVFAATADPGLVERLEAAEVRRLDEGVFGGAAAATLLWAEAAGVPAALVATPARPNLPDVPAAAALVAAVSRLLDLGVDPDRLRARGDELERAWIRLVEDAQVGGRRDAMYT